MQHLQRLKKRMKIDKGVITIKKKLNSSFDMTRFSGNHIVTNSTLLRKAKLDDRLCDWRSSPPSLNNPQIFWMQVNIVDLLIGTFTAEPITNLQELPNEMFKHGIKCKQKLFYYLCTEHMPVGCSYQSPL